MRPDQERFQDGIEGAVVHRATRRGILASAAKLAGGGALAVAFAGTTFGLAGAQDEEEPGQRGGGGRRRGTRGGGGRQDATVGDDSAAAAAPAADDSVAAAPAAPASGGTGGALPGVGVGSTVRENSGNLAGLVGVAAVGAAALAVASRSTPSEQTVDA